MKRRCSPKATGKEKRNYFDRGISVCDAWLSFESFLSDMGEAPEGASIDRINVNGNYEKGNCRWATAIEQANNTRANRRLEIGLTVSEVSREVGIKANTISYRLLRGWSETDAISRPPQMRSAAALNIPIGQILA